MTRLTKNTYILGKKEPSGLPCVPEACLRLVLLLVVALVLVDALVRGVVVGVAGVALAQEAPDRVHANPVLAHP